MMMMIKITFLDAGAGFARQLFSAVCFRNQVPLRSFPHLGALLFSLGVFLALPGSWSKAEIRNEGEWESRPLSTKSLLDWDHWGRGYIDDFRGQAVQMRESDDSLGLMLTSPDPYGERVVLSYEVMTLRPATVLVAILSASGSENGLGLPEDYEGGMEPWINELSHYFFAFHNAPHSALPFVVRSPRGGWEELAQGDEPYMQTGRWYRVEAGRDRDRLWLRIDGETVFEVTDKEAFPAGHLAFRIRGTGVEPASCLIRNVIIKQ